MENSNLKTLLLKMQDPLCVETEGLGTIALSHWSIGAAHKISKILEEETEDPEDFARKFIAKLGRVPTGDDNSAKKYEKGTPIEGVNRLTREDLENVANSYIAKYKNSIFHWASSDESEEDELAFEKEAGESTLDYFLRVIKLSVKKSSEQSKRLLEEMTSTGSAKGFFKQFNENKFKIGSIADRINDIQNTYAFPSKIEPRKTQIPDLSPNPVHETNELLNRQTAQLRGLSELLEAQGEQAILLNNQTGLLIGQSNESSRQTKIGIWVAAAGIFLSTIVSGYAIYRSMESYEDSSRLTNELVAIERKNSNLELAIHELLQELNTRMEAENLKNSDNTELLYQLRELTEAVKAEDDSEVVDAIDRLSQKISGPDANNQLNK